MGITFTFATRQKWHTSCILLSEDSLPSRNDAGGFGWTVSVLVGRENFPTRRTKDSHNRNNLVSCGRELKTITCSRMLSREVKMDVNFTSLPSLQSQSTSQSGTGSVSGGIQRLKHFKTTPMPSSARPVNRLARRTIAAAASLDRSSQNCRAHNRRLIVSGSAAARRKSGSITN